MYVELRALGDVQAPAHKTRALLRALPYEMTVLLCVRQRDDSPSKIEGMVARASSFDATHVRGKASANKE